LIHEGKDDSLDAESIRDALDVPLKALNRIERERAQWLSDVLDSFSDAPTAITLTSMNSEAQRKTRDVQEWNRDAGI
jgi:hypothetical protein